MIGGRLGDVATNYSAPDWLQTSVTSTMAGLTAATFMIMHMKYISLIRYPVCTVLEAIVSQQIKMGHHHDRTQQPVCR